MRTTEKDITGSVARRLRQQHDLKQSKFWGAVGVQQSVGSRYESEHAAIPKSVRILIVARYVCGLKIDTATDADVASLALLGEIQSSRDVAKAATRSARIEIRRATELLQSAATALKP